MSNLFKNLLIALGIALLLGFIYFIFLKDEDIEGETVGGVIRANSIAALEIERILSDTQKITSYLVEEHSDILRDRRFISLIDRRVDIPEVGTGRENPFSPVQ